MIKEIVDVSGGGEMLGSGVWTQLSYFTGSTMMVKLLTLIQIWSGNYKDDVEGEVAKNKWNNLRGFYDNIYEKHQYRTVALHPTINVF